MSQWYLRDEWRDLYWEKELLSISSSRNQGLPTLDPLASSSETPLIGCVSLARLEFSAVCLKLTAWFSSRGLLPATHLFDLSALIVLSCLIIKIWQLAKPHGVTRNEPKIHVIFYITVWAKGPRGRGLSDCKLALTLAFTVSYSLNWRPPKWRQQPPSRVLSLTANVVSLWPSL